MPSSPRAAATAGWVQLRDPAVRAACEGSGRPLGQALRVRPAGVDLARRKVTFARAVEHPR